LGLSAALHALNFSSHCVNVASKKSKLIVNVSADELFMFMQMSISSQALLIRSSSCVKLELLQKFNSIFPNWDSWPLVKDPKNIGRIKIININLSFILSLTCKKHNKYYLKSFLNQTKNTPLGVLFV